MPSGPVTQSSQMGAPEGKPNARTQPKARPPDTWRTRLDEVFKVEPMDPDMVAEPKSWHVDGLLMEHKITGIFGAEKAGKSRLLRWLLAHAYAQQPIFGHPTKTLGKTLYMLGEETAADVVSGLRVSCELASLDYQDIPWSDLIQFMPSSGMRLDQPQPRAWMADMLRDGKYQALVIDPLRRVHGGKETSNDDMALITNALRDWTNRLGLSVILIHHTGKISPDDDETRIATWSRGATDLPTILDWAFYVKRFRGQTKASDQVIVQRTGRDAKRDPLRLVDYGDVAPGWTLAKAGMR